MQPLRNAAKAFAASLWIVGLLVAASCSAQASTVEPISPDPTSAPALDPTSAPNPTAVPDDVAQRDSGPCELVPDVVVEQAAESAVIGSEASDLQGLPLCLYRTDSGARVQVVSLPAQDWVAALPSLLDIVEGSGLLENPENEAKFAEASELLEAGGSDAGEGACDVFSLLVELQGLAPGSEQVINFVPDAVAPRAVNGQRCSDATFSSIQVETDGLVDDGATLGRIDEALAVVHAAGLTG